MSIDIDWPSETEVRVGMTLSDGGDGALPYSQWVQVRIETGTWDKDVLDAFVNSVAESMGECFGYSRPKIEWAAFTNAGKLAGGRI